MSYLRNLIALVILSISSISYSWPDPPKNPHVFSFEFKGAQFKTTGMLGAGNFNQYYGIDNPNGSYGIRVPKRPDSWTPDRFTRELDRFKQLETVGGPKTYGIGTLENGTQGIIMEHIEGEFIAMRGNMDPKPYGWEGRPDWQVDEINRVINDMKSKGFSTQELQGKMTPEGRFRPIDPSDLKKAPGSAASGAQSVNPNSKFAKTASMALPLSGLQPGLELILDKTGLSLGGRADLTSSAIMAAINPIAMGPSFIFEAGLDSISGRWMKRTQWGGSKKFPFPKSTIACHDPGWRDNMQKYYYGSGEGTFAEEQSDLLRRKMDASSSSTQGLEKWFPKQNNNFDQNKFNEDFAKKAANLYPTRKP